MADTQTPQPDYDAIAQQAYEWLKKRRAKGEISTFEVLMKINGYKCIYAAAFDRYAVSRKTLLRYAGRRNRTETVNTILKEIEK